MYPRWRNRLWQPSCWSWYEEWLCLFAAWFHWPWRIASSGLRRDQKRLGGRSKRSSSHRLQLHLEPFCRHFLWMKNNFNFKVTYQRWTFCIENWNKWGLEKILKGNKDHSTRQDFIEEGHWLKWPMSWKQKRIKLPWITITTPSTYQRDLWSCHRRWRWMSGWRCPFS